MREDGFYWVCYRDTRKLIGEPWEVAEWKGDRWLLCGVEIFFADEDFAEIGERITRDPVSTITPEHRAIVVDAVAKIAGSVLDSMEAKFKTDFDEAIRKAERMLLYGK